MRLRQCSVWMLLLLLIGSSAVFAKTPQEFKMWEKGENLLMAGHFEGVVVDGTKLNLIDTGETVWTLEDGTCCDRGGEYTWELDTTEFHTGQTSLKVIGVKATGTAWHAKVRHESTSMRAGKQYTVAFWAKAEKSRPVQLSVQLQHDPWTFFQGGDFTLSEEWVEYTKTFAATEDIDRDMWVGLAIAESDVDFWLDDIRFWEGEFEDEIPTVVPGTQPVDPAGKTAAVWGQIKSR